jgi:hypothetical protein
MDFTVLLDLFGWSPLDARREFSSTLLQTLIVAPLVSVVVTRWHRANERRQRIRMIPHLVWSTYPIRMHMDAILEGPEGDFVRGGLAMFARQFDQRTDKMYDEDALAFYLGQPSFLVGRLRERVTAQVDYVDGLLDLFAPHFRTSDAIHAQRLRSALRKVEVEVDAVGEATSVLRGSLAGTVRFLRHLEDADASEDASDGEAAAARRTAVAQTADAMIRQADGLTDRLAALPGSLDAVADAAIELVEGFYDGSVPFDRVVASLRKTRWYQEEEALLGAGVRGASPTPEPA